MTPDPSRDPIPRGVLQPDAGPERFHLDLRHPTPGLAEIVEHYWRVAWSIPAGEQHPQHTLPHPCAHLVAEERSTLVYGLVTGRFTRMLAGAGHAMAIKFRPAGFRPFLGRPMSELTNREVPVSDVFGAEGDAFARRAFEADGMDAAVAIAEGFLLERLPPPDPELAELNRLVAEIQSDRTITRVETVARRAGVGTRTLQRQFADRIGISPKWVIKRYRLQDAADRLCTDQHVDLASLALELGYFDQAHLARDFRSIVGWAPATYARRAAGS